MIRDIYAEQLDDLGKPVRGGYDMTAKPSAKPANRPTSFKDAAKQKLQSKMKGEQSKQQNVEAAAKKKTSAEKVEVASKAPKLPEAKPKSQGLTGGETKKAVDDTSTIKDAAKAMGLTVADVRNLMATQPGFAAQIQADAGKQKQRQEADLSSEVQPQLGAPPPLPGGQVDPPPVFSEPPPAFREPSKEAESVNPASFFENYGKAAIGQNQQLESHLTAADVFNGTPEQLTQFARMLGIPQYEFITNPDQLRGAIMQQRKETELREILTRAGVIGEMPQENAQVTAQQERQPGAIEKAVGDFGKGFLEGSGLRGAKNIIGAGLRAARTGRFGADQEVLEQTEEKEKTWNTMTPLERAMYEDEEDYNAQQTYGKKEVDRLQAQRKSEKPGIEMPSNKVDNEDAKEGDQLGLFGEGKKASKKTQFKLENEKEKGKQKIMFDRMNDHPDQKSLFSTFAEAADRYSADLKKK